MVPFDRPLTPKDNKFVEAALGEQECYTIIARDRDLTVSAKPFGIDLYNPRDWLIQQQPSRSPGPQTGNSPSSPATKADPAGANRTAEMGKPPDFIQITAHDQSVNGDGV